MSRTAAILAALVCGGVLGYALTRVVPPSAVARDAARLEPAEVTARTLEIWNQKVPLDRIAQLSSLLQQVGPESLPAVTEAFDRAPIYPGDPELVVVATWWAAFDPRAAFAWTQRDWRANSGAVIAAVFRAWALEDPREALKEVGELRFPGQRELAKDAIYSAWEESGQPGLWETVETLSLGDQQRVTQILAQTRVTRWGAKKALEWAQTFPAPATRELVTLRVASAAAKTKDGARLIAEWATPRIQGGAERPTGLPRRIGTRWVRHDPVAAMAWLESLPAGPDRDDGVMESFRDWMLSDFSAAQAWIRAKIAAPEIEPWCEPAVAMFARTNGMSRPQESLETVARFRDERLRDSTTVVLLMHWLKEDRAAADAWLAKADLSEDVRQRALTGFESLASQRGGMPHGPLGPPDPE